MKMLYGLMLTTLLSVSLHGSDIVRPLTPQQLQSIEDQKAQHERKEAFDKARCEVSILNDRLILRREQLARFKQWSKSPEFDDKEREQYQKWVEFLTPIVEGCQKEHEEAETAFLKKWQPDVYDRRELEKKIQERNQGKPKDY